MFQQDSQVVTDRGGCAASASGEQVFVPPEEDVRFFDASALPASSTDEKQVLAYAFSCDCPICVLAP